MEGGLNIKERIFIKLLIFLLFVVLLLGDYSSETSSTQNLRILVGGGPGTNFCLFDFKSDTDIEVISCSIKNTDISNTDFIEEIYKKGTIHLSTKNKEIITELIQKIVLDEPVNELGIIDANEIKAFISNKVYLSTYGYYNDMYYDENLAKLTYKLVELSPIQVGGKHNPIKVPKQR